MAPPIRRVVHEDHRCPQARSGELDAPNVSLLPVPPHAAELLDFTGRWGMERLPQRQPFGAGTHVRENRRGRTGLDAAYLLHASAKGSGFSHGETWALHTAWSGNHRHVAEHDNSGVRLLGGGELLMTASPGRPRRST